MVKSKNFCLEAKTKGCYIIRHGKRHDIWYSPITGNKFSLPRHDSEELGTGLEKKARKVLGL